jgi:hypothetical protein
MATPIRHSGLHPEERTKSDRRKERQSADEQMDAVRVMNMAYIGKNLNGY